MPRRDVMQRAATRAATAKIERGAGLRAHAPGDGPGRRPSAEPEQPEPLDAAETAAACLVRGCTRSYGINRNLLAGDCPATPKDSIALEIF